MSNFSDNAGAEDHRRTLRDALQMPGRLSAILLGSMMSGIVILYIIALPKLFPGFEAPVPFLLLYASVVFSAIFWGLRAGLASAVVSGAFIFYAVSISFGPESLTCHPVRGFLGVLLYFLTAYLLGKTKDNNIDLLLALQANERNLEARVSQRTAELQNVIEKLENETNQRKKSEKELRYQKILLECQMEALPGAILIVSENREMQLFNRKFLNLWQIPKRILDERSSKSVLQVINKQIVNPVDFLERIEYLYAHPAMESRDEIFLKDGQILERFTAPVEDQEGEYHGRIWYFQDVTDLRAAETRLKKSEQRYRVLFEESPIPLWEQDFTELKIYLDALKENGVRDFKAYFKENPDAVRHCVSLIKIVDVNNAALALHKAKNKAELIAGLDKIFCETSLGAFREEFIALADGQTVFETESHNQTLHGEALFLHIELSIEPDLERRWSRVLVSTIDITERKRAEEALMESKQVYRAVAEDMPVLICRFLPGGEITYVNRAYCDYFNKSYEDLVGSRFLTLIPEEDRETVMENIRQLNSDSPIKSHEHQVNAPDGKIRWQRWTNRALLDNTGKVVAYQSIGEDITERKRMEQALQKSEEKYRQIVQTAGEGIWVIDRESTTRFVNKKMAEMLGYTVDEMLGKPLLMFMDDEGREIAVKNVERRKQGIKEQHEFKFQRKNGSFVWTLVNTNPLFDKDRKYEGALAMIMDITARKKSEIVLKQQAEYTQKLLETTLDGYILADPQGNVVAVNPSYCNMIGYHEDELLKMNIQDLEGNRTEEEIHKRFAVLIKQGRARFETRHRCKNGRYIDLDVSIAVIAESDGKKVAAFVRDITDSKDILFRLRESEKRFQKLFNDAPIMYVITRNVDGRPIIADANNSFLETLGYQKEEVVRRPLAEFYSIESRLDLIERGGYHRALTGAFTKEERELVSKDGMIISTILKTEPDYDRDKNVVGTRAMYVDITARRNAEKTLRESEERFRQIAETIREIFWMSDLTKPQMIYISPAFEEVWGIKREVLYETPMAFFKAIHPDDQPMVMEKINLQQKGETTDVEYRVLRPDGSLRWIRDRGFPIRDQNGKVYRVTGIAEDITERKKVQEALEDSNRRMQALAAHLQTIREEERTVIAREIHDEFGQILTVLKLDLSFIERELNKKNGEIDTSVIHTEIDTINQLIDQSSHKLSQLITELRPEIIDNLGLIPAIEWQVKEFQKHSGIACELNLKIKNVKFKTQYRTAIYRIIQASLTNVLRHSRADKVKIEIKRSADSLLIKIADNGIGIDKKKIDSITSFGIVGMKERVIILGGELQISGKPGKGTTVTLSIPWQNIV